MPNKYINLWTLHTPDFSITDGRIDHSKSKYYQDTHGLKQAYPELWRRINIPDGQIIWCYLDKMEILKTGTKKILWEICLPESEDIWFIDDIVWNRILKRNNFVIPQELIYQWRRESRKKYHSNPTATTNYEKKCEVEFRNQEPKGNSWWDELFVKMGERLSLNALIRHPIRKDWVKDKIPWYIN